MTKAYKCDNCNEFFTGEPEQVYHQRPDVINDTAGEHVADLCTDCWVDFAHTVDHHPEPTAKE